jgi:hypothetical protein
MPANEYEITVHGKDYTLTVEWQEEQESYRDVYGEDPPEGYEYYFARVPDPREHAGRYDSLASCGFIDVPIGPMRAIKRRMAEVEADLIAEATHVLTVEDAPRPVGARCE